MNSTVEFYKGYSEGPFGQIHWRMIDCPVASRRYSDLYCLHPAPYSGLAFATIMPHLAVQRRVIAPDYPGHGGSDMFTHNASIYDYAAAMGAVVADLSGQGPVDLMGFHSGCLVATHMAVAKPAMVNRLALVDVPAFDASTRAKYLPVTATPLEISTDLTCLTKAWDFAVAKRIDSQPLDRSFSLFVEQLRHGRQMNAAFHAAFTYDVDKWLPALTQACLIMATKSGLLEPTRRANRLIKNAQFVERLDITRSVLEEAAQPTAIEVKNFLNHKP